MAISAVNVSTLEWIAVGQKHRKAVARRLDTHPEARHHIRPVVVIGDAAEALGLALRAEHAVRHVEPGQFRVGGGITRADDLKRKGRWRNAGDGQGRVGYGVRVGRTWLAVDRDTFEGDLFTIENQRCSLRMTGGIEPDRECRDDAGLLRIERDVERHAIDAVRSRLVILKQCRSRRVGIHVAASLSC